MGSFDLNPAAPKANSVSVGSALAAEDRGRRFEAVDISLGSLFGSRQPIWGDVGEPTRRQGGCIRMPGDRPSAREARAAIVLAPLRLGLQPAWASTALRDSAPARPCAKRSRRGSAFRSPT